MGVIGLVAAMLVWASPAGFVDKVDVRDGTLEIAGWAVGATGDRPTSVEVWLAGEKNCEANPAEVDRPDVRQALGRPEMGRVGWAITCPLVKPTSGNAPMRVLAHFGSPAAFELPPSNPAAAALAPVVSPREQRTSSGVDARALALGLLLLLCASGIAGSEWLSQMWRTRWPKLSPGVVVAATLVMLFGGLVGLGITGSSLELGRGGVGGLIDSDGRLLAGKARDIRSDEWLVLTPLAMAQSAHVPRFPVVNRNLGPEGENMLVIGMVGVPVWHLSALARPATWGHFAFDLRRALAWQWWLPVFGCLFSLWWVMSVLAPGQWKLGLMTAGIFTTSAYVVAWSHWPAYAVTFPAIGLGALMLLLRASSLRGGAAAGALLGWAVAGFVLVLYPPWQVSVGYLFLALAAALLVRDRARLQFGRRQALGAGLAVALAGAVVGAWWLDARPAVDAMNATVYPGRRVAVTGGALAAADFVRGFENPAHHWREPSPVPNPSEAASFPYLFPVCLAAILAGILRGRRPSALEWALAGFCAWGTLFQFIGMPGPLAKVTLWGRVPETRVDLALGLASLLACGVMIAQGGVPGARRGEGLLVGAVWAAGVVLLAATAGVHWADRMGGIPGWGGVVAVVMAMSWAVWHGAEKTFAAVGGLVGALTAIPFNPWAVAPSHWRTGIGGGGPVLTVGSQVPAMMLLGAGVPVANGVFHYPQSRQFKGLDPNGSASEVTNRYQHLLYEPTPGVESHRLDAPQPDVVRVAFNPEAFEFANAGAARVLAPAGTRLSANRSLGAPRVEGDYLLYPVKSGGRP